MKKIKKSTDRNTEKSLSGSFQRANSLDLMYVDFDAAGEKKYVTQVGSCGNFSFCGVNAAVACHTCYTCGNYKF
ncbi:hypothetical protein V8G57_07550 [Collimonas sp. H4R21]|uniref:Lantibiotic n=1 Tax=Collimonas rhizosphaerae TaxID=3126357 RepID=A0ABU9PTA9_9BURK